MSASRIGGDLRITSDSFASIALRPAAVVFLVISYSHKKRRSHPASLFDVGWRLLVLNLRHTVMPVVVSLRPVRLMLFDGLSAEENKLPDFVAWPDLYVVALRFVLELSRQRAVKARIYESSVHVFKPDAAHARLDAK